MCRWNFAIGRRPMKPFPCAPRVGRLISRLSRASVGPLILALSTGMWFAGTGSPRLHVGLAERTSQRALAVSPNVPPVLAQPSDMAAIEGGVVEQVVTAADEDGQSLEFFKVDGPDFLSVATTSSTSGSASARIHLSPSFIDAGSVRGSIDVSDGIAGARQSFVIDVADVPRMPSSTWSYLESGTLQTADDPGVTGMADLLEDPSRFRLRSFRAPVARAAGAILCGRVEPETVSRVRQVEHMDTHAA